MKRARHGIPRLSPPSTSTASPSTAIPPPLREGPAIGPKARTVVPAPQQETRRNDAPLVLPYRTGSFEQALAAVSSTEQCQESARTFQSRALQVSTRDSRDARLTVWLRLAEEANVSGPLTRHSTEVVVGALLRANYRSAAAYFSAAKAHHISTYKYWDPELDLLVAPDVTRACKRGQGPSAKAAPFPLLTVAECEDPGSADVVSTLPAGAPADPWPCAVLSTWALLREIESANASLADVRKNKSTRSITIIASASKTDISALGVSVTLQCTCTSGITVACPYCIGVKHLERLIIRFEVTSATQLGDIPLFPSKSGSWCTKQGMIEAITALASQAKIPAVTRRGTNKWGGHAYRRGGVHLMAALGFTRDQIKAVARHSSSAVDGYLEGADLKCLRNQIPLLRASAPEVAPLQPPSSCPNWARIRMVRGSKVHANGLHHGRAICGWPWAASASRCIDAGTSAVSCGRCLRSYAQASTSSRLRSSSSSSSAGSDASV